MKPKIHIAIDTQFAREGFILEEFEKNIPIITKLQEDNLIEVVGIYSHLALRPDEDLKENNNEVDLFDRAISIAKENNLRYSYAHLGASYAVAFNERVSKYKGRIGIGLLGVLNGLEEVITLRSKLAIIKDVPKNYGVSYGHFYRTKEDTKIGVVPFGYADGNIRQGLDEGTGFDVLINGKRYSSVGTICMDQFMVDLGKESNAEVGDEVIIFGQSAKDIRNRNAKDKPTLNELAGRLHTIPHTITTSIAPNFPRVYE